MIDPSQGKLPQGATIGARDADAQISWIAENVPPEEIVRRATVLEMAHRTVQIAPKGGGMDELYEAAGSPALGLAACNGTREGLLAALNVAGGRYLVAQMRLARGQS